MADADTITKSCTKCGEVKPLDGFYISSRRKDGICPHCKECMKAYSAAWRAANPERVIETKSKWRDANKERERKQHAKWLAENVEKNRETHAKWYAANRERQRENWNAWYTANRDRVIASSAAYRDANRERVRAVSTAWKAANPEADRVHKQNRRSRKRDTGGKLSRGIAEKLLKLQKGKCACCGKSLGSDYHLDHIMPLALGGMNVDNNIQLLRAECNRQKHAKHPVDFMRQRGFLL